MRASCQEGRVSHSTVSHCQHQCRIAGRNAACMARAGGRPCTARVPVEQQRLILAFDWWIANGDRTKGNTNLLFDQTEGKIVVIDHNNALDPDLQFVEFCENHIFGAQYESVFNDLVSIAELQERFGRAASGLAGWLAQAPVSWKWTNPEEDVPTRFDAQSAVHTLAQRTRLAKDGLHG